MLLIVTPVLSATMYKDNTGTIKIESYEETKQNTPGVTDIDQKLKKAPSISSNIYSKLTAKKQIQPLYPWDVLLEIEITQSTITAGIGADQYYIYAPEWSDSNIYYWDFDGVYQGSFNISGVSGLRDLAYDHSTGYIWGGNGAGTCWEMDFTEQSLIRTITGSWQCRAITYEREDDCLYVSGWGDPVWKIDKDGSIIESFNLTLTTSTYGFAYDKWDTNFAGLLWVHDQGGTGCEIRAYDLEAEEFVEGEDYYHDVTQEVPGGIAGGLFLHDICPTSYCKFIVNAQATIDTIVVYEWYIMPCCPQRDIGVKSINYPKSGYADDNLSMQTTFINNGNRTEIFDAQMTVITTNETGEVLFNENFSTYGTGPNGLPENWTTDWWKWCNRSGNPCACVYYRDQANGGDYYDNYITTPEVNCSGLEKIIIKFWLELDIQYTCYFYLRCRKNKSSPWIDITPWENPIAGDTRDWYTIGIYGFQHGDDIGEAFQLNWSLSGYYGSYRYVYLDDVKLESYDVDVEYSEIVEDITVPKGEEKTVDFPSWTPTLWQNESHENTFKEYPIKAEALIDDDIAQNDIKYKLIELYFPWMHDVGSVTVDGIQSGPAQTFNVTGIIKNFGQYEEGGFKTYVKIVEKEFNKSEYNDSIYVESIESQEEQELDFKNWTPAFLAEETSDTKSYLLKQWTELEDPQDRNTSNDLYQVEITLDFFHDVGVEEIISPKPSASTYYPMFSQRPYLPNENWSFYTSSSKFEVLCYDDFYDMEGTASEVQFYGLSLVYPWSNCDPTGILWEFKIYEYGTSPGVVIWEESDVELERWINTGQYYSGFEMLRWEFGFFNADEGWISIQSTYSPNNCNFLWAGSPEGNFNALQNGKPLNDNLAFNCTTECCCYYQIAYIQPGIQDIDVLIMNYGTFPEQDMTCYTEIYEYNTNCTNGTILYEDNITDIELPDPLGGSKELNFNDYNFIDEGFYQLIVNLTDDNDDKKRNNKFYLGVGVDNQPPITEHVINPPDPTGDNGWYVSDVEITLTAQDPNLPGDCEAEGSGVDYIEYRIDGGSWMKLEGAHGTFTFGDDGEDVFIEYRAVDRVGNEESINSFTIDMEQTTPVAEEISWDTYKEGGFWYVDLTASAVDVTSLMDRVEFFINDRLQEIIEGRGPDYVFTLQWSEAFRKHSFFFYHYDRAGNVIMVYFDPKNVKAVPQSKVKVLNQIVKTTYELLT